MSGQFFLRVFSALAIAMGCALLLPAQNLVPNGSFEEVIECPDSFGNLEEDADHWFHSIVLADPDLSPTPDYFNSCALLETLTPPNTSYGFQEPRDGESFAGIISYANNVSDYREIIGVELLEPLNLGQEYVLNMSVVMAYTEGNSFAISGIGFKLSTIGLYDNPEALIDNNPTFSVDSLVTDTSSWLDLSIPFIADSNYTFLHIGNFFEDSETEVFNIGGFGIFSAYYIDRVAISGPNSVDDFPRAKTLRVFPNPTTNSFTIHNNNEFIEMVEIYDSSGKNILTLELTSNQNNINISLGTLASGLYRLVVFTQNSIQHETIIKK
jgi:hypothetical protein